MTAGVGAGGPEVPLRGGIANEGQVFRVGDTVRRPQHVWSRATHALLLHLEAVGFEGAPRFLGVDSEGREVLSYIPGTAVVAPYPVWGLSDEALLSVAELLRNFHEAVATFDAEPYDWPRALPAGFVRGTVSHNDVNLDNVVFRDGRAAALIDFDLAAPGSPVWDVACAARLWAPLRPDDDITDDRRGRGLERFRMFVDGYGLTDPADRARVAEGAGQNFRWFCDLISTSAARGHAAFANYWRSLPRGRVERTVRWFADNERALHSALGV